MDRGSAVRAAEGGFRPIADIPSRAQTVEMIALEHRYDIDD